MKYRHTSTFSNKCFAALIICIVTFTNKSSEAFVSNSRIVSSSYPAFSTELHMFGDAFKKAFSNDDKLGKPKNAGLKNVCDIIYHSNKKKLFFNITFIP